MKAVRLSALGTGRLNPKEVILILISVTGCRLQGQSAAGRITSMKNSNEKIEPATFHLIAQCLNEMRYGMPHAIKYKY
jgi:hypothetical protein